MNSGIKSLLSPRGIAAKSPQIKRQNILLPPYKTPSRLNVSSRLNQSSSQILSKTSGYIVEQFGSQLPVLVTEALKFSDGNSLASVNIASDGWAWFVCGRRLLAWQAGGSGSRPVNTQCRELSLPPSDLAHRAHLVTVYTQQASQMPCCLAVSPEGIVRYWSSIAHESSWIEVNAELQGQECDSLHLLFPLGVLLVTTTATLVLVTPHFAAARHSLLCRTIKTPHGWLGGISRRMSSLIFGSIPATQIMETKLVKVVTCGGGGGDNGEWTVVVLAGHSLQKWQLCSGEMEQLIFEGDLGRPLREAFINTEHDVQELLLLDMQATDSGVMLLVAAAQSSTQLNYALVAVRTNSPILPVVGFRQLTSDDLGPLVHTSPSDPTLQFLLLGQVALIYNATHIVAIPAFDTKAEVELLDFGQGQIVGGTLYGRIPVFFSTFNGFISVLSAESAQMDSSNLSMNELMPDPSISETNIEELTEQKDNVGLLKAAFLLYIRKQQAQSKAALANLFFGETSKTDTMLGTAVLQTSLELINDVPAKDPRWADQKSNRRSIASTNSLQIVHQLEEKQKVLQWFASFLKDLQLWDKLGSVTHAGRTIPTTYVLQEHAEKVVATLALKKAHPKYVEIVDSVIEKVLTKHNKRPSGNLTNQDLFYRQASLVHEAIHQIVRWCEDVVFAEQNSLQLAVQIATANSLLWEILSAVSELRDQVGSLYQPAGVGQCEKKLWTTATGQDSIGGSLMVQIQLTAENGIKNAGDPQLRAELLDQLTNIVDFALDGRKCHVESLRDSQLFTSVLHQYESDRLAYIQIFMSEEDYERATMLAEKYLDFQVLIDICECTKNKDKLNYYIQKFSNQGFANFLFTWYIREQKQSNLVQHCNEKGGEKLVPLLDEHPSLLWLHQIAQQDFKKASDTLKGLAKAETQLMQRRKTQLSLAKLSLLASSDTAEDITDITSALTMINFQEHLPAGLLVSYGYDVDNIRIFTPSELVKLYISDENPARTEFTFKTALDILNHIEDGQEKSDLSAEIWSKAVLKDTWIDMDPNAPQSAIQQLFFFKVFDLCILEGCEDMVPSIESLLCCEELGHLKENSTFQYLLQVGYEHFSKDSIMATL